MENENRKWLTKNVLLLGLVSFFSDISGEMMTPILPLFIVAVGGTTTIVGLIGGIGDAVANFMKVFSGYFSDKYGKRKNLLFVGYGIPFIAKFSLGFSTMPEHILVLKPTERLGKGIRGAPRDSLLADSTTESNRGKVFGFHRSMDTAGAVLGSFLSLLLIIFLYNIINTELSILRLIIIVSSLISLLSLIPIFLLSDTEKRSSVKKQSKKGLTQNLKKLPREYYHFLIISTFFGLANFTLLLFIIHTNNIVSTHSTLDSSIMTISLFIIFNLSYTSLSMPFGILSDKVGRKLVLILGLFLLFITNLGFILYSDVLMIILLYLIYGAFYAASDGILKAYTVDLVPKNLKGTGLGLLQTIMGFASIAGGGIAGYLMEINSSYAFLYGSMISIFTILLLLFFKLPQKSELTIT